MASSIFEALEIIAAQIPTVENEIISIENAINRVIAQNYIATFDLPRFNNSAMDGYVVKVEDAGKTVSTHEVIYAGDNPSMTLTSHTAIKIMTGAPIPMGGEAIVPIENVIQKGTNILLPKNIQDNHFIRMAGEDIKKGDKYVSKGEIINAYTIASLASQGISHVTVFRKIKVTIFATGDELRPHYEKIEPHQLYNSNSPMFLTRCKSLGCEVRFIHTAKDTLEALESSIKTTLDTDIIITSGGVSVGDKDFTKEAFSNLGMQVLIDKIDIKPGKPTVIGKLGHTSVINLPGNPLAAMVNFELFVRAIIKKLSGKNDIYHKTITTIMKSDFTLRAGKYTVLLGSFDGESFEPLKSQMPGMVSPMQKADGLIIITPDIKMLRQGESIQMLPIRWEFSSSRKESII